ncbi:MAG: carboxypeptidase regulatory-like domain-containing protein, partial [Bacteroidales bacterium]|nr:carboxypeptidase regulatory-like domain-containing protein [Bacteroidales bacterium]
MNITLLNKRLVLILISVALAGPLLAQHALTGTVSDQQGEALGYATVALLNPTDSILNYFGVTDSEGSFRIRNIKEGDYLLQYSFVGMETLYKNISIPASGGEDLGTQALAPNALEEVSIIEEYIPITFKSDTVEFNPNAYNTKSHAVVEDLLKKMPGIEVDEAGN